MGDSWNLPAHMERALLLQEDLQSTCCRLVDMCLVITSFAMLVHTCIDNICVRLDSPAQHWHGSIQHIMFVLDGQQQIYRLSHVTYNVELHLICHWLSISRQQLLHYMQSASTTSQHFSIERHPC